MIQKLESWGTPWFLQSPEAVSQVNGEVQPPAQAPPPVLLPPEPELAPPVVPAAPPEVEPPAVDPPEVDPALALPDEVVPAVCRPVLEPAELLEEAPLVDPVELPPPPEVEATPDPPVLAPPLTWPWQWPWLQTRLLPQSESVWQVPLELPEQAERAANEHVAARAIDRLMGGPRNGMDRHRTEVRRGARDQAVTPS